MKKTLYTLNLNGYAPEITALTYPLLRHYAKKIGAEFFIIGKRKFPEWPVTYEKLQIYELAKQRGDDWSIYLDSDALVHPETLDWTAFIPQNTVAHNGLDFANVRWRYDGYFLRDGRNIGSCNWCAVASIYCRDLWHPLELSPKEAVANIFPTASELGTVITPEHLIDDYALSRNIARYGLKATSLMKIQRDLGFLHDPPKEGDSEFFWHQYTITVADKVAKLNETLDRWNIPASIRNGS